MFVTKFNILQHVLKILDIDTKGKQLLLSQTIDSVGNMIHNKYGIYRSLVYKTNSKLSMVYIDKIFVFQKYHHANFIKIPTTPKADILYNFTEEECGRFYNSCISNNLWYP